MDDVYTFSDTTSHYCDLNVLLDCFYQPICLYTTIAQYRTGGPQIMRSNPLDTFMNTFEK